MAIQTHFTKFHNKIKLTRESDQYADARKKDDNILSGVRTAFRESGYPIIEDFLQGSFSTNTAIYSLDGDFDIDRAVVIDEAKAPDNPITPKKETLKVLEQKGFKKAKIKKPCVTADYAILALHIDIPVYSRSGNTYKLAVGKANSGENHREWSHSDPKGLRDWINDDSRYSYSPNSTQQQLIRIVRYMKRWRDHKFSSAVSSKIFSIGLTVMVKQCFQPKFDDDGKPDDLQAFKATVDSILIRGYFSWAGTNKYRVSVPLPVSPYRDIFNDSSIDTGTQLQNKLINMQIKLGEVCLEDNEVKQCQILNKLLGDDFQIPTDSTRLSSYNRENRSLTSFPEAGVVGTSQGA